MRIYARCGGGAVMGSKNLKAIAVQGEYFGVAATGGFLSQTTEAALDHFVHHVEHLVDMMGIDHVGIGCDKCGPGPRPPPLPAAC